MSKRDSYVTSFCNFPHWVDNGRPIGHECHILPPAMLRAEYDGDTEAALEALRKYGKGPVVRGRDSAEVQP